MAAAFSLFYASGILAPGGFWFQCGLDSKNKLFKLNNNGVGIKELLTLDKVTLSGNIYRVEFDSHINEDSTKPCHVIVQVRKHIEHPWENALSWLAQSPDGKITYMDSHGAFGDNDGDGWVLGNSGIQLRVV